MCQMKQCIPYPIYKYMQFNSKTSVLCTNSKDILAPDELTRFASNMECYGGHRSADLWLSRRSTRNFPEYITFILVSPGSKK